MKRRLVLAGIILLVAGVLFEEKHRAETFKHHIVAPELSYLKPESQAQATNSLFSDNINLWGNSPLDTDGADLNYASAIFQTELKPASIDRFQPVPGNRMEPVLTVMDRELAYALFASKDFTLTLNLKPEYSTGQALVPSHIDPGVRGSLNF